MAGEFARTIRSRVSTLYKKTTLGSFLQEQAYFFNCTPGTWTICIEKQRACKTYRSVHRYILWDQTSRELESAVPRISVSFFRQKIDRMVAVLHGKYAWHNLKANVQGEGLPSWPDIDAPP